MRIISATAILLLLAPVTDAATPSLATLEAYEARIEAQQRELDALREELEALKRSLGAPVEAPAQAAASPDDVPVVGRKGGNGSVELSGRVHRMLMNVDDGASNTGLFADSLQGPTMLRVDAGMQVRSDFKLGGTIEVGVQENSAARVSQDNPNAGTDLTVRLADLYLDHQRYGRLSLGRGFASSWLTAEMDASGTQFASLLSVGMVAPALKFVDASNNQLSNISVGTYFFDVERLLRLDRVRYDSVSFGPGLQLSGSLAADDRWDMTLRARPKVDGWSLMAGMAYQHQPFLGRDSRIDGVMTARHEGTGLNLTLGIATEQLAGGGDTRSRVVKAGWLADLNSMGKTAFAVDFTRQDDIRLPGDESESIGFVVMQKWIEHRFDFYGAYRVFDVKRPDITLKDLNVFYVGALLSF